MSFRECGQFALPLDTDMGHVFSNNVRFVLEGAEENPPGSGHVVSWRFQESSRKRWKAPLTSSSPPHRTPTGCRTSVNFGPYMYWLGFLDNGRDAGELDWTAIGGTWGIATSRLLDWERPMEPFRHPLLDAALDGIEHHANKNGRLLANYVAKYFEDIWRHFNSLVAVLNDGSEIHYIVGNSTFYNVPPAGREAIRCHARAPGIREGQVPCHTQAEFKERVVRVRCFRPSAMSRSSRSENFSPTAPMRTRAARRDERRRCRATTGKALPAPFRPGRCRCRRPPRGFRAAPLGVRSAGNELPDGFRYLHETASLYIMGMYNARMNARLVKVVSRRRHQLLRNFSMIPQGHTRGTGHKGSRH